MNTLKIVRITSEKRFNDSVKVALFDENQNIIKEVCFEDVTVFDISDNIDVKANNIRMENEKLKQDIKEQQTQIKEMIERKSKELQQLQKEKTEAIKEYYKRQNEKISNMTERQLLEEIYRELERSNNAAKNIHTKRESR